MFITVGLYGAIDCSWGAQEAALERARRQAFRGASAEARFVSPKKVGELIKKVVKDRESGNSLNKKLWTLGI
jgi:hypothetical protein